MRKKKLNLTMLTALVAGNMIGSGVFLLPADLAKIGSISILAWICTAIGAFFLAMVFAQLSHMMPKTGGPYAYAKAGMGQFIGFQTAYSYWIALWVGNAAIALAAVGYLAVYCPVFTHPIVSCFTAICLVWIFTIINISGVRSAGAVQIVTTILKLMPILLIAAVGWWFLHPTYLTGSFNVSHLSNTGAFSHAAALTLWSFVGVESATVPAASVDNPRRNIPIATLLGTLIAAVVYIASATAIMGIIPAAALAKSSFPFAAAAQIMFGKWGAWIIGAGAVISCLGALNGWTLLQGQVPMAAADDHLFPHIFSKRNEAGVPIWGLIITSTLITLFLMLAINPNLVDEFRMVILMATFASVVAYLYTSIAEIIILKKHQGYKKKIHYFIAGVACVYTFWIILSVGKDVIFYGMIMMLLSFPLYTLKVFRSYKRKNNADH